MKVENQEPIPTGTTQAGFPSKLQPCFPAFSHVLSKVRPGLILLWRAFLTGRQLAMRAVCTENFLQKFYEVCCENGLIFHLKNQAKI